MLLSGEDNLRYTQFNTELNKNYTMGLDGCPQDILEVTKLLKSYLSKKKKRHFRKTYGKEKTGLAFT